MPARIDNSGTGWVPEFQLRRLILIDSYSPGRVEEFPLNANAVLTGRNGTGKTTLLQLIPIFWGERPSRIIVQSAASSCIDGFESELALVAQEAERG